ncbi:MAG: hypothetical protein HY070_09830 [Chloroflexi bacterium]|nr:hypothetical protein [Chloroflexota bacterium]
MSAKSHEAIQHWWVTASDHSPDPKRQVRWEKFFQNDDSERDNTWGGPDWIKASLSIVHIKEMRKSDVVVAYQAGEGIVGLAYLKTNGYQDPKSRKYDSFDLEPSPTVWLNTLVPLDSIRHLSNAKQDIEFIKILRGTVFSITQIGFRKILDLIIKFNPDQRKEINDFLSIGRPIPEAEVVAADEMGELKPTRKTTLTIQRVIRDSAVGKELKQFYKYKCQVCGKSIELPNRKLYAEIHHLRPVGKPHNGKDGKPNTIVVCPNHHAMFDLGAMAIDPNSLVVKHWNPNDGKDESTLNLKHRLDKASLNYQYQKLFKGTK